MRSTLLMAFCLSSASALAVERTPPQAQCIDARNVQSVRALNDRALLISTPGAYAQIDTDADCSQAVNDGRLLTRGGWACGSGDEYVETGSKRCAITAVHPVDAKSFSRMARALDRAAGAMLPAIETKAERPRGFLGSFEYCVRPSQIVGWNTTTEGLRVVTRPKRHGGFKEYAIEFANACPESRQPQMSLVSNMGLDLVCGNPGDVARFYGDITTSLTGTILAGDAIGDTASLTITRLGDCNVSSVYPVR